MALGGTNDGLQQPYVLEKVYSEVHSERTSGNKHKMKQEKLWLDIRRKKFHRSGPETSDKDAVHRWWYWCSAGCSPQKSTLYFCDLEFKLEVWSNVATRESRIPLCNIIVQWISYFVFLFRFSGIFCPCPDISHPECISDITRSWWACVWWKEKEQSQDQRDLLKVHWYFIYTLKIS